MAVGIKKKSKRTSEIRRCKLNMTKKTYIKMIKSSTLKKKVRTARYKDQYVDVHKEKCVFFTPVTYRVNRTMSFREKNINFNVFLSERHETFKSLFFYNFYVSSLSMRCTRSLTRRQKRYVIYRIAKCYL